MAKQVVIITGASQGIGYNLSLYLKHKGYIVYGLSRSKITNKNINYIKCDLEDENNIKSAINEIYNKEKRIDILINNAGIGISGSIEASSIDDVKKIFNVNVFGPFLMTKYILPIMRKQRFGKIVNIGSVASEFSIPFQSFYSSTKSSLRDFTLALKNEVSIYGIGVSLILPGDIKTNFTKNRKRNDNELNIYKNRVKQSIEVMEKDEENGYSVNYATKKIYKVIKRKNMPLFKTIGNKYKFLIFLKRLLPINLVNNLVGKIYGFKSK